MYGKLRVPRPGIGGILLAFIVCLPTFAGPFNGAADHQADKYGYYYAMTGGKDPGQTWNGYSIGNGAGEINGDNATGGTFRYVYDDPYWGGSTGTWHRDDWFAENMSIALTLQNSGATVYDNNGILDGTHGDFYGTAGGGVVPGLYRGYAMSNNWDWIYAGMFILGQATTIDTIWGFFDPNSGFDPFASNVDYHMNIWSAIHDTGNYFDPVDTGTFAGDLWSSDSSGGTWTIMDSGVDRLYSGFPGGSDDIWKIGYILDNPITLEAGVYFFGHDATIPEPTTVALLSAGVAALARKRRKII